MLRPVHIEKLVAVGSQKVQKRFIREIHNLGIVEIKIASIEGVEREGIGKNFDKLSNLLGKLRAVVGALGGRTRMEYIENWKEEAKAFEESKLYETIGSLEREIKQSKERIADIEREEALLHPFEGVDFGDLECESIKVFAGRIKKGKDSKKAIEKWFYKIWKTERGEWIYFLGIAKEGVEGDIEKADAEFIDFKVGNVDAELKELEFEKGLLQRKIEEAGKKKEEIAKEWLERLQKLKGTLKILIEREKVLGNLGKVEGAFVLEGWIREKDIRRLDDLIEREFKGRIYFETYEDDKAPTELSNPKFVRNFEFLVEFFSLPKSWEIDPTLLLFFTFPVLYGMMVGDVGYGVISLIFAWIIKDKVKPLERMGKVWIISSVYAIIFGVIFDEWMGVPNSEIFRILREFGIDLGITSIYTGFSRLHNVNELIMISAGIGFVYIVLGFILGAINEWGHSKKHSLGKVGWVVFMLSVPAYLATQNAILAGGMAGAGLLMIIFGEGIGGLFEIGTVLGNVLSYARIAAVGVSGVVLAEIINEAFMPRPEMGWLAIMVFPLLMVFHFLNAGLAMFESTIQGGRLNLVEFYSKFFKGGGRVFKPFFVEKIR
ncbi:MAG: V-type ATPase 116kDa subunit family protein [Candidatus Anstonellales archaeon]